MTRIEDIVLEPKSTLSQQARDILADFAIQIDTHLEKYFDTKLKNPIGFDGNQRKLYTQIWTHIKEHNLRPAKRLRASFMYYGYYLLGGKDMQSILDASMSIELIHTALLMHDDVMDQDDTRRGSPTTHEYYKNIHTTTYTSGDSTHYGYSMAINVGDIALLSGYEILSQSKFDHAIKIDAINRLLQGIVNTGYGQSMDVTLESIGRASEEEITHLHHAKTAIYTYENPLHIGALLAGGTQEDFELISEYAIPGGIAFQLQDDILGLFGDSEKTGKPDHSDISQGKITLLYIKALENADQNQRDIINKLYGKRDITSKEAQIIREIIRSTQSVEYSRDISVQYAQQAQKVTNKMRKRGWNPKAIDYLDGIAQYMIDREV